MFWNGSKAVEGVKLATLGLKGVLSNFGASIAGFFTAPVLLTVLAVIGLGLAFKQAYDKSKPIRDGMERLGNESGRMRGLYEAVEDFKNAMLDTFNKFKERVEPVLEKPKIKIRCRMARWGNASLEQFGNVIKPYFRRPCRPIDFLWVNVLDPLAGLLGGYLNLPSMESVGY